MPIVKNIQFKISSDVFLCQWGWAFSLLMVGFHKGLLFPAALNGHTAVLEEFLAAGRINCCFEAHYLQLSILDYDICLINNMGHVLLFLDYDIC